MCIVFHDVHQQVCLTQRKTAVNTKTPRNYHHYSSTAFLCLNQPKAQTFRFRCVVFSLCFVVRFGRLCLSNTHTSCCSRAHEALYQSSQSSADSPANSLMHNFNSAAKHWAKTNIQEHKMWTNDLLKFTVTKEKARRRLSVSDEGLLFAVVRQTRAHLEQMAHLQIVNTANSD